MGYVKKNTTIILIILSMILVLQLGTSAQALQASRGNIERDIYEYYPETQATLTLTNLSIGYKYGLLLGANQNASDQQWINFTAIDYQMAIPFVHFDRQSYIDNRSQPITYLYIILYGISSNTDTSPTKLDSINLTLVTIKDQFNPYFWGMVLVVFGLSLVGINIIYTIIKEFG